MTAPGEFKARRSFDWRDALSLATSLALLVAAITVTVKTLAPSSRVGPAELKVPTKLQSIKGLPSKGNTDASVALIIYSDFQCPFCKKFATQIMPAIEEKFVSTGRLVLSFRHYPLEAIHPLARGAADAAACAARQGRFWQMHDQLFKPSASLDRGGLLSAAAEADVRPDEWRQCLQAGPVQEVVDDVAVAHDLQIGGTPFFVLGASMPDGVRATKVWSGSRPIEFVGQAIEEAALWAAKQEKQGTKR